MITNTNEYKQRLKEIQESVNVIYTSIPSDEPRFVIDANSRQINIPSEFSFLALKKDHKAETIYFEIDRYFDDNDLSNHTCVIQFELFSYDTNDLLYSGISPITSIDIESEDGKIIFGWALTNDVTQFNATIRFSVRFFTIENDSFTYSFNTLPAISIILDTLDVDDSSNALITPSELQNWLDRMNQINNNINELLSDVNESVANAEESASEAKNALSDVTVAKTDSINTIDEAKTEAVKAVADAGSAQKKILDDTVAEIVSDREQISANTTEISELKGDLTEKIPLGINIKNYLDSGNMKTGGYIDTNTGNVIDYESWCYSDYIATKPGATLCTIGWDSAQNLWKIRNTTYVAFYNANKTFISGYISEAGKTYNVPKSCSYMRVSFSVDELNHSPMIVEKDVYDKMESVEDRIPYGNFVPTIYDKKGSEYVLIRNPYCVKSYDKLFFKFDSIVFYKNGVEVQLDYNFLAWKEMFPNNWQGYPTSKMSDCVFLKNNEVFMLEVETKKPKIITRPYFLDNPEKYILILGYDSTNQSYGPFDAQYRLLNDDSYERQRFESLSNETLTKLYDQANPVYKILSDEHFCFAWLSDNHLYGTAGEDETDMTDLAIGEIDKNLNFNAIFNTGDSIQEREGFSGLNSLRKIANRFDPDKLLFCEGNHDRNVVSPRLTKTEFYNVVYRQTKNKNIVWGSKENAYYYRDFPTYKIRVIVLNLYEHMYDNDNYDEEKCGYSNTQLEWLANKALQTLEGWSVIVLTHDSPIEMAYNGAANQNNAVQLVQILEAFKDGNNIAVQYTDTRNSGLFSVNVTTAFSMPGTLIAVLSGHAHCDDAKKVNGINYMQIACAYIDVINDYSGYKNRPAFSEKAYAFDIGVVDTENRTLKLKRIGYGMDRSVSY